jgi:hypothetical protein
LSGLGTGMIYDITAAKIEDTRKEIIRELAEIKAERNKKAHPFNKE